MKKGLFLILGMCLMTAACATEGTGNVMAKMKTCLTDKGWQTVLDGTLYANGISETAKQITKQCLADIPMYDAVSENQTIQMATGILTALSSAKQTQK